MSNIYDIVINMPADPPAGLEGVRWCIGKVTVAPELHEELSRRLSHAFDFITGGGHRVQFIQWGASTLLTAGLSRLQVVAGRLDRHTASFPAAHELISRPTVRRVPGVDPVAQPPQKAARRSPDPHP